MRIRWNLDLKPHLVVFRSVDEVLCTQEKKFGYQAIQIFHLGNLAICVSAGLGTCHQESGIFCLFLGELENCDSLSHFLTFFII